MASSVGVLTVDGETSAEGSTTVATPNAFIKSNSADIESAGPSTSTGGKF